MLSLLLPLQTCRATKETPHRWLQGQRALFCKQRINVREVLRCNSCCCAQMLANNLQSPDIFRHSPLAPADTPLNIHPGGAAQSPFAWNSGEASDASQSPFAPLNRTGDPCSAWISVHTTCKPCRPAIDPLRPSLSDEARIAVCGSCHEA